MKGREWTVRFGAFCVLVMSVPAAMASPYVLDWRGEKTPAPTRTIKPPLTFSLSTPGVEVESESAPWQVGTPILNPKLDVFANEMDVLVSCPTSGAEIRITMDGSTPTSSSPLCNGVVTIKRTTVLRAKAFKNGMTSSAVTVGIYVKMTPDGFGNWIPTKDVTFTCSRHPEASTKSAQGLFNEGAKVLEKDDDGPGDGGMNDDVPLKVYFTINTAPYATFPDQSWDFYPATERYDYRQAKYKDIPNEPVLRQLLAATFANIKQVNSCYGGTIGATVTSNRSSMVLTQRAMGHAAVHEWGHLCGLDDTYNPTDNNRIMYGYQTNTANEINNDERAAMLVY